MEIACIGTGFVGVVTAAVFAHLGNKVVGIDIDEAKIAQLKKGIVPFYEPGLPELLVSTQKTGNLSFTTDYAQAISGAEVIFIMVGTPSAPDGQADLQYLFAAVESLSPHLGNEAIVVIKSTVPPGTNTKVYELLKKRTSVKFELASVPEFLREGTAVQDTLHPDRIVLGVTSVHAREVLTELHTPLTSQIVVMKPESAQMCKYAANNYLATRITFINQIADLCEHNGADIQEVINGIGMDSRIGTHYWYPGMGYGGSCFPKDVKEIAAYAKSVGELGSLFIQIDQINSSRIPKLMNKYDQLIGGFAGKTVAVLGLSFKRNTNDTREAPANYVIPFLVNHGATVRTVDPQVPADFTDPYLAIDQAHVTMILVEWDEYCELDLTRLAKSMQSPKVLIDTRNLYEPAQAAAAGLQYQGVGR